MVFLPPLRIGGNAGLEAVIGGLDITIAVINPDDEFVFELFHVINLSFKFVDDVGTSQNGRLPSLPSTLRA